MKKRYGIGDIKIDDLILEPEEPKRMGFKLTTEGNILFEKAIDKESGEELLSIHFPIVEDEDVSIFIETSKNNQSVVVVAHDEDTTIILDIEAIPHMLVRVRKVIDVKTGCAAYQFEHDANTDQRDRYSQLLRIAARCSNDRSKEYSHRELLVNSIPITQRASDDVKTYKVAVISPDTDLRNPVIVETKEIDNLLTLNLSPIYEKQAITQEEIEATLIHDCQSVEPELEPNPDIPGKPEEQEDNLTEDEKRYVESMENTIALRNEYAKDSGISYDNMLAYASGTSMHHWADDILRMPDLIKSALSVPNDVAYSTLENDAMYATANFIQAHTSGTAVRFFDKRVLKWAFSQTSMKERVDEVNEDVRLVGRIANQLKCGEDITILEPEQYKIAIDMISKMYEGLVPAINRITTRKDLNKDVKVLRNVEIPMTMECTNTSKDKNLEGKSIDLISTIDYMVIEKKMVSVPAQGDGGGMEKKFIDVVSMVFICPIKRNADAIITISPKRLYYTERAVLANFMLRTVLPKNIVTNAYVMVVSEKDYEQPSLMPIIVNNYKTGFIRGFDINGFALESLIANTIGIQEDSGNTIEEDDAYSNMLTGIVDLRLLERGHQIMPIAGYDRKENFPFIYSIEEETFIAAERKSEAHEFGLDIVDIEGNELPDKSLDYIIVDVADGKKGSDILSTIRTIKANATHSKDVTQETLSLKPGQMVLPYAKEGYEIVFPKSINYSDIFTTVTATVYVVKKDEEMQHGYTADFYLNLHTFNEEELMAIKLWVVYSNAEKVEMQPYDNHGDGCIYRTAKVKMFEPFELLITSKDDDRKAMFMRHYNTVEEDKWDALYKSDIERWVARYWVSEQ